MNRYPDKTISLTDILHRTIRLHYLTLKHVIGCVLLITLTKYIALFFLSLSPSIYVQILFYLMATAAMVYLFSAAMLATHRAFIDQPNSTIDAIKTVGNQIKQIYVTFFTYAIGTMVVFYFSRLLVVGIENLIHEPSSLTGFAYIIALLLSLLFLVIFYFCFPLSVIDEQPIKKAFYRSILLTDKQKLGVLTSIVMLGAVMLLLTPGMISEYFLSTYHLDIVFDFVVLCVAVPLYINLLLLLIDNAKKQMASGE